MTKVEERVGNLKEYIRWKSKQDIFDYKVRWNGRQLVAPGKE